MRTLPSLPLVALCATACSAPPGPATTAREAPPAAATLQRVPFEVDLGGWQSRAELVHPAPGDVHGNGPWPVVLLVCGNGPHDMDVTLPGKDGGKLFALLADTFAARGFAVVRYHKRFVRGPGDFDARFWREQSTPQFVADANQVLQQALTLAPCDRERLFVHGWSEGTAVGARLAIERGDVDGLVLQGPVGLSWRDTVRFWIERVGMPYAAGADGGSITARELGAALTGDGGMVAKLGASFFADPKRGPDGVRVSTRLDTDGDGALDPDREVRPRLDELLDFAFSPFGNVHVYADGRTVPEVTAQASQLQMPVLILQGEHDASTPLEGGRALAAALRAAGNRDVELCELAGRGHTLGPAASLVDDRGRIPDAATLLPIAAWLAAHARR